MKNVSSRKSTAAKDENYQEGPVATAIERQTAKIPSDVFLWAAIGSMATSLTFKCMGRKHDALFFGQWAAPFLVLGLYNKLVKLEGHDSSGENDDPADAED